MTVDPATVLADMLVAAADNMAMPITRRIAEQYAADVLELLAVAGYVLIHDVS